MVGALLPPGNDRNEILSASLLYLLSNILVLDGVVQLLSLSSIFALSKTSKSLRSLILKTPHVFRYLDLSRCRGAYVSSSVTRIDSGGHSWRAQRMDENLSEDEFYAGPLRGVLGKLGRMFVLKDVQVLVLDGLGSVTVDLVSELAMNDDYNVRILSVIGCVNLNQHRLRQLMEYLCRPGRPEGAPRLKGLYNFGRGGHQSFLQSCLRSNTCNGVTCSEGAQLGSLPTSVGRSSHSISPWYAPAGLALQVGLEKRNHWQETLQYCSGIIAFDAVLCTHMHAAVAPFWSDEIRNQLAEREATAPPIAAFALGPAGCAGCGRAPEGAPVWNESELKEFPLLTPPPHTGRIEDAVRPPTLRTRKGSGPQKQRLIVSCKWCLIGRHCENCHRWWCGECYDPKNPKSSNQLSRALASAEAMHPPARQELDAWYGAAAQEGGTGGRIKVYNGLCVDYCLVGEMMAGAGSNGMWA